LFEIQQDAFAKLIDFRRFLFALSFFLKETQVRAGLNIIGKEIPR